MSDPKEVQVRIVFSRIGEIDTLNEKYFAEIIIESKWEEPRLASEIMWSNECELDLQNASLFWNPKISIKNSINETNKQYHYRAYKVNTSDAYEKLHAFVNHDLIDKAWSQNSIYSIVEYQTVKGWFFEKLELNYFPIDVQDLSIILTSSRSKREILFSEMKGCLSSVENNTLDKHIWHLYHHVDVNANYDGITDDPDHLASLSRQIKKSPDSSLFPRLRRRATEYLHTLNNRHYEDFKKKEALNYPFILFQCRAARKSGYYYWNCFFLIFLITSVVFTTFSIEVDKPFFRLPTTATLLLTSITFRWIYSGKCLPTVNYLTSLDKYALISLICIYLCLLWHGGISQMLSQCGYEWSLIRIIDKYILGIFLSFYVGIHFCLLFWLRKAHKIRAKMIDKDAKYYQKMLNNVIRTQDTHKSEKIDDNLISIPKKTLIAKQQHVIELFLEQQQQKQQREASNQTI